MKKQTIVYKFNYSIKSKPICTAKTHKIKKWHGGAKHVSGCSFIGDPMQYGVVTIMVIYLEWAVRHG